jgi:hypothetical protein
LCCSSFKPPRWIAAKLNSLLKIAIGEGEGFYWASGEPYKNPNQQHIGLRALNTPEVRPDCQRLSIEGLISRSSSLENLQRQARCCREQRGQSSFKCITADRKTSQRPIGRELAFNRIRPSLNIESTS